MLAFKYCREQFVLAIEMIIERALGDFCSVCYFVDPDAPEALARKRPVGRIEYAPFGCVRGSGHDPVITQTNVY